MPYHYNVHGNIFSATNDDVSYMQSWQAIIRNLEQAARVKPFEHVIIMKMRNRKVAMCFKKHFPLDAARVQRKCAKVDGQF
jgi:hypothetical protein